MQDVYLYAGFIRSYAGWTEYASVVGQGFSLYYCTVGPVESCRIIRVYERDQYRMIR